MSKKLSWKLVPMQTKIIFLKDLMENSVKGIFDVGDLHIVDALITGSTNQFRGELGFNIEQHHMFYMKSAWELAINNQIDDSITEPIKKYLEKL